MLQAIITRYPVQVLTPVFLIHGHIEPMGSLLDYLNDVNRGSVPFVDVTLYHIAGKLAPTTRPMIVIGKQDICGLYVDDAQGRAGVRLLQRFEKFIVHLPNLVCRGEFHLGNETRIPDVFDVMTGQFFALTNASVFPVVPLPAKFPQKPELFLAHKSSVQAFYAE